MIGGASDSMTRLAAEVVAGVAVERVGVATAAMVAAVVLVIVTVVAGGS